MGLDNRPRLRAGKDGNDFECDPEPRHSRIQAWTSLRSSQRISWKQREKSAVDPSCRHIRGPAAATGRLDASAGRPGPCRLPRNGARSTMHSAHSPRLPGSALSAGDWAATEAPANARSVNRTGVSSGERAGRHQTFERRRLSFDLGQMRGRSTPSSARDETRWSPSARPDWGRRAFPPE